MGQDDVEGIGEEERPERAEELRARERPRFLQRDPARGELRRAAPGRLEAGAGEGEDDAPPQDAERRELGREAPAGSGVEEPVALQLEGEPAVRRKERSDLGERRIGVINAAPTGMGLLTPRGVPAWHPAPAPIVACARRAVEYCQSVGADIVKLAIQFSIADPRIATTLIGSANPENTRRNIAYADEPIDFELMAKVLEILKPVHNHNFTRGRPENRDPIVAWPRETLRTVGFRMGETDRTRLPVISDDGEHRLLGMISVVDLLRANEQARQEDRRRERVLRVGIRPSDHRLHVDKVGPEEVGG